MDPDVNPVGNPEETGGEGRTSLFDFSGDARVRVLHRNEKTQRYEPHGYFPVEATEETVLEEFGGGRYRVQLLVRDDTGREVIKTQREIDLPGAYKAPLGDLPGIGKRDARTTAPNGATPAVGSLPSNGELMQALNAGVISSVIDLLKSMREVKTPPAAPTTDPMLLEFIRSQSVMQAEMFKLMIAVATKEPPKVDSESKDYLGMLGKMKEILAPAGGATNQMEMFNTMLETFQRMREVAEDVASPSGNVDPVLGSIPKIAEVLYEQHQLNKNARGVPPITATQPMPGPAGGVAQMPVVGTIPPAQQATIPVWQRVLRQQSTRLLAAAAANADPEAMAAAAIVLAPPQMIPALREFFHREPEPVMGDVLAEIPALAEHREWVAAFIENVQFRLFPEEFDDEEPETTDEPEPETAEPESA